MKLQDRGEFLSVASWAYSNLIYNGFFISYENGKSEVTAKMSFRQPVHTDDGKEGETSKFVRMTHPRMIVQVANHMQDLIRQNRMLSDLNENQADQLKDFRKSHGRALKQAMELGATQGELAALQVTTQEQAAKIDELSFKLASSSLPRNSEQSRIKFLEGQIAALIKLKNDQAVASNKSIFGLHQDKQAIAAQLAEANEHNRAIGGQLDSLRARHDALVSSHNAILKQKNGLIDSLHGKEKEIVSLNAQINVLKNANGALVDRYNELEPRLANTNEELDSTRRANLLLARANANLQNELAAKVLGNPAYKALSERAKTLEAQLTEVNNLHASLRERHEDNIRLYQVAIKENKDLRGALNQIQSVMSKI